MNNRKNSVLKLTRYGSTSNNNYHLNPKLYYPIKTRYYVSNITPYSEITNSEKSLFERAFNVTHNSDFSDSGRRLAAILQYKNQYVLRVQYTTKPD